MQQQVGVGDLLQGRTEGVDQLVGQLPDKADGVGERELPAIGSLCASHGRVQGREELILDQHARPGEPVDQRGLAGVGVAGDRHARGAVGLARVPLGVAVGLHLADFPAQLGDSGVNAAPVQLDLGLTGAARADALTAGDSATGLP